MNKKTQLNEIEKSRLVEAIESALEVQLHDQFHDWMYGPFCALLPHESLVCLEIGDHGEIRQVDFMQHRLVDAEIIDILCNPVHGLALRLTRLFRTKPRMSYTVDAKLFESLLKSYSCSLSSETCPLTNAVVHRARFLSGTTYFFVLFNVPEEHVERNPYLFKLLSSHLKLVLSRVINTQEMNSPVSLTDREFEIIRWLADSKSTREIGVALKISPITVKSHISKVFRKLDVQNRADAVSRGLALLDAMQNGQRRAPD